MKKRLNWKLKQLPTGSEVAELVKQKIITAEEARQILFNDGLSDDDTILELKRQIDFLEGLVKKLSTT